MPIRRARAALLGAVISGLAVSALATPLTSLDDRSDILGWEAVGRLDIGARGGYCSGSLIAPDLVLTAAHCLFDDDAGRRDPAEMTFQAGLRDGAAIATSRIARVVVPKGYDPALDFSAETIRYDAALLELETPIPATTADPFPIARSGAPGQRVTVLSYGQGRSNAMSREIGCTLDAAWTRLMAFDCTTHPGSSGAPLFDMSGRSARILSIVSGGGQHDGRSVTYGMEIAPLIAEMRRALRTGEGVWPEAGPVTRRVIGAAERSSGQARFVRP